MVMVERDLQQESAAAASQQQRQNPMSSPAIMSVHPPQSMHHSPFFAPSLYAHIPVYEGTFGGKDQLTLTSPAMSVRIPLGSPVTMPMGIPMGIPHPMRGSVDHMSVSSPISLAASSPPPSFSTPHHHHGAGVLSSTAPAAGRRQSRIKTANSSTSTNVVRAASSSPPSSRTRYSTLGAAAPHGVSYQRRQSEPGNTSTSLHKVSSSSSSSAAVRRASSTRSRDRPTIGRRRRVSDLTRDFYCPQPDCNRRYEAWRSLQHHLRADHNLGMKLREYKNLRSASGNELDLSSRASVGNNTAAGSPTADDLLDMEDVLYDVANAWHSPVGLSGMVSPPMFSADPLAFVEHDEELTSQLRNVFSPGGLTHMLLSGHGSGRASAVVSPFSGLSTAVNSETPTPERMSVTGSRPGTATGHPLSSASAHFSAPAAGGMHSIMEIVGGSSSNSGHGSPLATPTQGPMASFGGHSQQQQQREVRDLQNYLRDFSDTAGVAPQPPRAIPLGSSSVAGVSSSGPGSRRLSQMSAEQDDALFDFLSVSFPADADIENLSASLPDFRPHPMF